MTGIISLHRVRNLTKNTLVKSLITINHNKETFNTHKELASNEEEMINIVEKTMTIFKQTSTKIVVTKKQLLILTIIILFYKLMLIIMKLLQKTYWNTKVKITIKKEHQAKKAKMHHRMKAKHPKRQRKKKLIGRL